MSGLSAKLLVSSFLYRHRQNYSSVRRDPSCSRHYMSVESDDQANARFFGSISVHDRAMGPEAVLHLQSAGAAPISDGVTGTTEPSPAGRLAGCGCADPTPAVGP